MLRKNLVLLTFISSLFLVVVGCNKSEESIVVDPPKGNTVRLERVDFGDEDLRNALYHTGIKSLTKYNFEFNTHFKGFYIWLEAWQKGKAEIYGLAKSFNRDKEKNLNPLGHSGFVIEESESFSWDDSSDETALNFVVRRSYLNGFNGWSRAYVKIDESSFEGAWNVAADNFIPIRPAVQKRIEDKGDFFFNYKSYGQVHQEGGKKVWSDSGNHSKFEGNGTILVLRGVFVDSYQEYEKYIRENYSETRPKGFEFAFEDEE